MTRSRRLESLLQAMALAVAALACAVPALVGPASADGTISAAQDGRRKINLSGRQRMLSQRMAKAICFASLGVDVAGHLAMARDAHARFDATLHALRRGDAALGLLAERAPSALVALDHVGALWTDYGAAVSEATRASRIEPPLLTRVALLNGPTLALADIAVTAFEMRYATTEMHPSLALAINIAGRQRMLTQKASKEFCLVAHGRDVDANRAALAGSVDAFETALAALRHGDAAIGLPEAPTEETRAQLASVDALWSPLSEAFRATAGGATPDRAQIARVATAGEVVLREMDRAVSMYEGL